MEAISKSRSGRLAEVRINAAPLVKQLLSLANRFRRAFEVFVAADFVKSQMWRSARGNSSHKTLAEKKAAVAAIRPREKFRIGIKATA
jgi:hypothetical protein